MGNANFLALAHARLVALQNFCNLCKGCKVQRGFGVCIETKALSNVCRGGGEGVGRGGGDGVLGV